MHDLKFVLFWLVLQIVHNMPLDIRFCFAKSSNLDNLEFKYRQEAFPESFFVACENEFIKMKWHIYELQALRPYPLFAFCSVCFCRNWLTDIGFRTYFNPDFLPSKLVEKGQRQQSFDPRNKNGESQL